MKKYCFFNIVTCLLLFKASTALCQVHSVAITDSAGGNLLFTENKNQWPDFIKYKCTLQNGAIFLEKNRFTYNLLNGEELDKVHGGNNQGKKNRSVKQVNVHAHAYHETFINANPEVTCVGSAPTDHYANYFIGNNSKHWASNVPLFQVVTYKNLYRGIDLTAYSKVDELTCDFNVSPGADADVIQLAYDGLDGLYLADGNLVLKTSVGNNVEERPYAYQIINGKQTEVSCNYLLDKNNVSFSFPLGYNHNYPLIIDPQFVFGTYSGSTSDNWGFTATYDKLGDMYIGGIVFGNGYPVTTGAYNISFSGGIFQYIFIDDSIYQGDTGYIDGYDIAIAKFNPTGTNLIYATYLGGTANEIPQSLVVNNAGNLLIYGRSNSTDYPVTSPTYQSTNNGGWDIIISELNSTGTSLLASTYVGGSSDDGANMSADYWAHDYLMANYGDNARGEIIVDNSDNVYVASCTQSTDFPTTPGAYQTASQGGGQDGCVFKLNSTLNIMLWSTYLGGSNYDAAYSLKLDKNDNVFVCGGTASSNFPSTNGALQPTFGGDIDGFITKLASDGSKILHSTFIGTPDYDQTYFLDIDSTFNVYVMGQSLGNFPVTTGVYADSNSAQFIEELDSTLSTRLFSTVFGTGEKEINISPTAFMIDTCQNIYVAGWGGEVNFQGNTIGLPITPDAFQSTTNGSDFYFIVFQKNAASLLYATYFGDPNDEQHVDGGTSRFDKNGYMYEAICGGCGGHSGLPTTPSCWSPTNNSSNCNEAAIKFKFDLDGPTAAFTPTPYKGCVPLNVNFINNSTQALAYEWNFGNGDTSSQTNPSYTFADTGTFKVQLIALNSAACKIADTAYAFIKVSNHVLHASFSKTEINFCDSIGVSFISTSNGGTAFSWNFGDGSSSSLENPSHTYTIPGIDTVTLVVFDTSFCNPYDTIKDTINFTDIVTAQIQDTSYKGCSPFTINFNDLGFGGKTFLWNFGDGSSSTLKNPSHTYTVVGTYHVSLYAFDPTTCDKKDSAFATVIVFPAAPVTAFTASPTLVQYLNNTTVQFTNTTTGATSYLWTFGDGDTSTTFNTSHLYEKDGVYKACLTASNFGPCPDSLCTSITVQIVPIIDVPNAFSPNGDGINDVLYVKGQGMASIDFKIFNRWGQLIFESRDMNIGWDGTYDSKPQEMEVYVWTLDGITLDGTPVSKKGNVTLLR
jgi:gliding motility-associated-like protein